MQFYKEAFLNLVQLGIGHQVKTLPAFDDWPAIQSLANRQGLGALAIDGLEKMPVNQRPPQPFLLKWVGVVLQQYEQRYELYRRAIAEIAFFYNSHGLKMMVLKGYACSLDWPKSEHRPCGDIDIWQFGNQIKGDALITLEKGIKVDSSHHHHTVFVWQGFTIENHYDFVNVHTHRSSAQLERIFKELGKDDSHFTDVCGERVYLPSPNLHSLFLIRHMVSHFAAAEISLRQVLDWAFFVEKHSKEVDWGWLRKVLAEFHMTEFFNLINEICVEDLGFDANIFPYLEHNPELKDRVLSDILEPEFGQEEPKRLIHRLVFKYKRWRGNAWKRRMCYNESMWSAFWRGIWAKVLKPAGI